MLTFPKRSSVSLLAFSTLALIASSYLFMLALCASIVALPFLALLHRFQSGIGDFTLLILLGMGLITAGTIVWSQFPRRNCWIPTGVELDLSAQPRLLSLMEEITSLLGEQKPDTFYLTAEASAWVKQYNGFLFFRRRQRIMGLGLPLLATLTVDQLRAILAHECAHFYEGDTRLAPLTHAARSAIARTLKNLSPNLPVLRFSQVLGFAKLLHDLVVLTVRSYWNIFFRVSQFICREQEYRSDELAACLAGTDSLREGLEIVHSIHDIVHVFWGWIEAEVIRAGYLPPLTDGFRDFVSVPVIAEASKSDLAFALAKFKASPYDSHPPLRCRLDQIERLRSQGQTKRDARPATTMLDDLPALERRLVQAQSTSWGSSNLQCIGWEHVGNVVFVPKWRRFVCEYGQMLQGYRCKQIPELIDELPKLATQIRGSEGQTLAHEQRIYRAADLIWMALALAMLDCNWILVVRPGRFYLELESWRVNPYEMLQRLQTAAISASEWNLWCDQHRLGETFLAVREQAAPLPSMGI